MQFSTPCTVYRGGTSRGLFFHAADLPADWDEKRHIFLTGIDAYNPSQINGLGSGTSHTSKVVIIGPPSVPGVDVDYTFVQIGIGRPFADAIGTCGNLMAAVGPFAVDEGLVAVDDRAAEIEVGVYDTNIKKNIKLLVPVVNGMARVAGDYFMPGVVQPGAKIKISILDPGGGKTGRTLPLGPRSTLKTPRAAYQISFVDVVNPLVIVPAQSLGLTGTESFDQLSADGALIHELNLIRDMAAVEVGMAGTPEEAASLSPAVPKIAFVAEPQDYMTTSGQWIKRQDIDVLAKMVSVGRLHRTFAGSALYALAAAILLPDTVAHEMAQPNEILGERVLRIGHPDGVAEVRAALTARGSDVALVGMDRTARRIMKGEVFTLNR